MNLGKVEYVYRMLDTAKTVACLNEHKYPQTSIATQNTKNTPARHPNGPGPIFEKDTSSKNYFDNIIFSVNLGSNFHVLCFYEKK